MPLPDPAPVDVPQPIFDLIASLKQQGFGVSKELYAADAFGNWQLILEHGPLRIEVLRDRSLWDLAVGGVGLEDEVTHPVLGKRRREMWIPIGTWQECLGGREVPVGEIPIPIECRLIEALWPRMEEALSLERIAETRECLAARGKERYLRGNEARRR